MKKLVLLVVLVVLVLNTVASAELVFWTQSGERVNVRDKPVGGEVIAKYYPGEPLPSGSYRFSGDRFSIPLPGLKTGYVWTGLVRDTSSDKNINGTLGEGNSVVAMSPQKGYIITPKGANLRLNPSTSEKVIGYAPHRARVLVTGISGSWYQVTYCGHKGFIWGDLIEVTQVKEPGLQVCIS